MSAVAPRATPKAAMCTYAGRGAVIQQKEGQAQDFCQEAGHICKVLLQSVNMLQQISNSNIWAVVFVARASLASAMSASITTIGDAWQPRLDLLP